MEKLSKTEARQGVTGHKVRNVLGISLVIAVIALATVTIFAG